MKLYTVANPLYVEDKVTIGGDSAPLINAINQAVKSLGQLASSLKPVQTGTNQVTGATNKNISANVANLKALRDLIESQGFSVKEAALQHAAYNTVTNTILAQNKALVANALLLAQSARGREGLAPPGRFRIEERANRLRRVRGGEDVKGTIAAEKALLDVQSQRIRALRAEAEAQLASNKEQAAARAERAASTKVAATALVGEIAATNQSIGAFRTQADTIRNTTQAIRSDAAAREKSLTALRSFVIATEAENRALIENLTLKRQQAQALAPLARGVQRGTVGTTIPAADVGVQTAAERLKAIRSENTAVQQGRKLSAEASISRLKALRAQTAAQFGLTKAQVQTTNSTEVLRKAQGKLNTTQNTLTKSGISLLAGIRRLSAAFLDLGRVIGIALAIGGAFRVVGAIEEGTDAAIEFSRAIAEIQTIQGRINLSTQAWAEELRQLSDAFGISILDEAEAAYQAISNQIVQTTEDFEFFTAANKLALATVSDASNSVNLLSSALKAFSIPATESEEVAGKFFKTVELGRVRAEELSNTFGRVGIFASQLGVSLDETLAGIASITVQGVKSEEALTLLRNIFLKLADPTEEFKDLLREQGFASGEALIAARGLSGTLALVEEATRGSSTEIAELFSRIRASIGVSSLIGDQFKIFGDNLNQISGAGIRDVNDAANKVAQSAGQRLIIEGQKIRNFFEKDIGLPLVESLANVNEAIGGFSELLKSSRVFLDNYGGTVAAVTLLLVTFSKTNAITAASIISVRLAAIAAIAQIKQVGVVSATTTVSVNLLKTAFIRLQTIILSTNPILLALTGITLAATAAIEAFAKEQREALKSAEQTNLTFIKSLEKAAIANRSAQNRLASDFAKALKFEVSLAINAIAENAKRAREEAEKSIRAFKDLQPQVTTALKAGIDSLRSQFKFVTNELTNLRDSAKNTADEVSGLFEGAEVQQFELQLDSIGVGEQLTEINQRIESLNTRIEQAIKQGNRAVVQDLLKQVRDLSDKRERINKDLAEQQITLDKQTFKARQDLREADTSNERRAARDRLFLLRRENQIRKEFSEEEADVQIKILKLLRERRTATPERRQEINKELRIARNEQQAIQKSAEAQAAASKENLATILNTGDALTRLSNVEKARAEELAKIQIRVQAQLDSLQELTSESKKFKLEEALKIKDSEELKDTLKEQENRLKEILRLNKNLGLEAKDRLAIEQQLKNLQETRRFAVREAEARELQQDLQVSERQSNAKVQSILDTLQSGFLGDNLTGFQASIERVAEIFATGDLTISAPEIAGRVGPQKVKVVFDEAIDLNLEKTNVPKLVSEISQELAGARDPERLRELTTTLSNELRNLNSSFVELQQRRAFSGIRGSLTPEQLKLIDELGSLRTTVQDTLAIFASSVDSLNIEKELKDLIKQEILRRVQEAENAKKEEDSRTRLNKQIQGLRDEVKRTRELTAKQLAIQSPGDEASAFRLFGFILGDTALTAGENILDAGETVADAFKRKIVEGFKEGGTAAVKAEEAERQRQREERVRKAREQLEALTGQRQKPTIAQQVESRLLKQLAGLPQDSEKRTALIQRIVELQFRNPSLEINQELLRSLPENIQQALKVIFAEARTKPQQTLEATRQRVQFDPLRGITPAIKPDFGNLPRIEQVTNNFGGLTFNITEAEAMSAREISKQIQSDINRNFRRGTNGRRR